MSLPPELLVHHLDLVYVEFVSPLSSTANFYHIDRGHREELTGKQARHLEEDKNGYGSTPQVSHVTMKKSQNCMKIDSCLYSLIGKY